MPNSSNDLQELAMRATYSVDEVSELLGISRTTTYECIRRGEIPAHRFGRRVVILRQELNTLLARADQFTDDGPISNTG